MNSAYVLLMLIIACSTVPGMTLGWTCSTGEFGISAGSLPLYLRVCTLGFGPLNQGIGFRVQVRVEKRVQVVSFAAGFVGQGFVAVQHSAGKDDGTVNVCVCFFLCVCARVVHVVQSALV